MRLPVYLGLVASSLTLCSCLNEGALVGPALEDEPRLASSGAEIRIVRPPSGSILPAGAPFDVLVWQELRGAPGDGRAKLQISTDSRRWEDLSDAVPWSSQNRQFAIYGLTLERAGAVTLRLVVESTDREIPMLESTHARIRAVGGDTIQVAQID